MVVVLGVGLGAHAVAQSRNALAKAHRLLNQLKLVDGTGSGLDADTIQGKTPGQLQALQAGDVATAFANVVRSGVNNVVIAESTLHPGICICVDRVCNGNDLLLNCSGEFDVTNAVAWLNKVSAAGGVCQVCGCNAGEQVLVLKATGTCLPVS